MCHQAYINFGPFDDRISFSSANYFVTPAFVQFELVDKQTNRVKNLPN